jgi:predicted dehydrogenase
MDMIRWGMIGCGSVTEMKSGPAFNKVPHSKLMAVMRRDEALLKDYAKRHQVPYTFTDASALIHHPEIDAIYIATPPDVHEAYAIEALKANKFVYVEKPMATSVAACEHMQQVAKEVGGKLVVAHYRRQLPLFLKVKELLAQNTIGNVTDVKIIMQKKAAPKTYYENNWRVNKERAGGGLFYDLAPHQLDLLFYFFGKANNYQGSANNIAGLYLVEDTVKGAMQMENGIQFTGEWCFAIEAHMPEQDAFIIIGKEGRIEFPVFGHTITIARNNSKEYIEFDAPQHNQQNLIEKVVTFFLEKGENPCSAEDALQSMRVMEAFVYGHKK